MHLNEKDFEKFHNNTIDTRDMIAFLEHLDKCDYCLDEVMHRETQHSGVTTPSYLKEQILSKAGSPEVRTMKAASETSGKMHLLYYSLRTAVGVIAALVLLFTIGNVDFSSFRSQFLPKTITAENAAETPKNNYLSSFTHDVGQGISNGTQTIISRLNDFSNKLINGGK